MALARVQGTTKKTASNTTVCNLSGLFPAQPTVGNAIIVFAIIWRSGTRTVASCTDNFSNPYTEAVAIAGGTNPYVSLWYCPKITTTGTPFNLSLTGSAGTGGQWWVASAVEISGVGTGLTVDKTATASGTSAAPSSGTTAALTASDVVLAAAHSINAAQGSITVVTATPTWTQEVEELTSSDSTGEADSRLLTSATGTTPSCSWTDTASNAWAGAIVAFAGPAAAGAAETTHAVVILPL